MIKTEHKYIIKDPLIYGGSACIIGTRIPVKAIVIHYQCGMQIEDILEGYPTITPAQLFDALSYYHDNKNEIMDDMDKDRIENIEKEFSITHIEKDGHIIFEAR